MSGRRLLDAAKLFNASTSIAKQHLALRTQQLEAFNKTSSLAKTVKNQTDRFTLTTQAAVALAKRLNEQAPTYSYSTSYPPPASQSRNNAPIPREEPTPRSTGANGDAGEFWRPEQHDETSEKSGTVESPRTGHLLPRQEKEARHTRLDGTVHSLDANLETKAPAKHIHTHELSADDARQFQRQSEAQIPAVTSTDSSTGASAGGLAAGHDQDVYYDRPTTPNSDYSSLPRAKIPKNTEERQDGGDKLDQRGINADTYYSTGSTHKPQSTPFEDEDVPEGVNINVFRTSRGSKMLEVNTATRTVDEAAKKTVDTMPESEENIRQFATEMAKDADPSIQKDAKFASESTPFQMRESRVPSSRLGRLWEYSGLATSMAFGAVTEGLRRVTGGEAGGSIMLSPGNMERLVTKLSRMRGAALKLGQMISFQDLKMLPAPIHEVLQRVQDSADYMPASQRDNVLARNLGTEWRSLFSTFDEVPMAAASIGQVHRALLASTGQEVAVKVQYPGVSSSIDSDLNNLSILLTASRLLPSGLFLDRTIANARTELAWECDYLREAECATRFKKLVADETDIFTVPTVIPEASGKEVMTAELMHGTAVTKLKNLTQEQRDWVGTQILRLCLREICEFRFMQTDPNWTNFLYNPSNNKLELLDFGACRDFPLQFIEPYVGVLRAASINDRASIRDLSVTLGYLTGSESQTMLNAHVDSVLTLAEPFKQDGPEVYDFRDQTITDRVRGLIPVMVKERMAPPPEETYSLHRKLSGAFLLCARLGARVKCRELFSRAMERFDMST